MGWDPVVSRSVIRVVFNRARLFLVLPSAHLFSAARNKLREMNKGELAFFYHSNCKTPAIVGIMRIVEEASPDGEYKYNRHSFACPASFFAAAPLLMSAESQFDPNAQYYDPASPRTAPSLCASSPIRSRSSGCASLPRQKGLRSSTWRCCVWPD